MDNLEAIEFLKNMIDREAIRFVCPEREGDVAIWQYHVEALQMAISALQAQEMSETQKALDTTSKQPEIIRCGECRFNDGTAYCVFHFRDVKGNDYCSWAERRTDGRTS